MRHQSLLVMVAGAALLFAASANAARTGGNAPNAPAPSAAVSASGGGGPIDLVRLCIGRCLPPDRIRVVEVHRRVHDHCGLEADGANLYYFDGGRVMRDCVPDQFSAD